MGNRVVRVGKVFTVPEGGDISPLTEASEDSGGAAAGGVEFVIKESEGDSSLTLNTGNARFGMWAEYLNSRSMTGTPVYVEADDETNEVLRVLPSYLYTIEAVEPAADGDGVDVCFLQSPAVSPLRASHPDFAALRERLSAAAEARDTLLVTVKPDNRELVDARPAPESSPTPDVSNGPIVVDLPLLEDTPPVLPGPLTPAHFERQLTLSEALFAFDFVASIPELAIPFKYPVDCCVARAHMMCRFLQERFGIAARKLWNYSSSYPAAQGTIRFDTSNHPSGSVSWRYHVAPVVSVSNLQAQFLVLDPSMFIVRPVPIQEWLAAQNDPGARQSHSDGSAFTLVPTGEVTFDDLLRSTTDQLDGHRLAWRSLRAGFFNPPPA